MLKRSQLTKKKNRRKRMGKIGREGERYRDRGGGV